MNNPGVRPASCVQSKPVKVRPGNPKAWDRQPSLACVSVMAGAKRRQEGIRGVKVNPEIYIVEDADGSARVRRPHRPLKGLRRKGLPGAKAHIENPGKHTEQERPNGNRAKVDAGAKNQGTTEGSWCQWPLGVGPFHSSNEACEGGMS
jgi:hypothetical protein